jgi:hypothetical protein
VDPDDALSAFPADPDLCVPRTCVLADVREPLLDDAEDLDLLVRRENDARVDLERASCWARFAADFSRRIVPSGAVPRSSIAAWVEIVNRYCASPSWISRATRARSSATARPNSAKRIARQTPASRSP